MVCAGLRFTDNAFDADERPATFVVSPWVRYLNYKIDCQHLSLFDSDAGPKP